MNKNIHAGKNLVFTLAFAEKFKKIFYKVKSEDGQFKNKVNAKTAGFNRTNSAKNN